MKNLGLFVLWVALGPGAWAAGPQAILQSLKGKVEVKAPGSASWVPATEGQVLSPAATLSTGFDSSVVVVIDKSTIQVKPLTRMTIDRLVVEGGTVKTSTFLRVGNVSASVKSADGVKQDFKVVSPFSTASVRGTQFDFDGQRLVVREGLVALVLGRIPRDQGPSAPGGPPPSNPSDYIGAPDVAGNLGGGIPVAAGSSAWVVANYAGGQTKATGSDALDTLEKNSGQNQSTPVVPPSPPATKGGVTLTIQFGS